MFWVWSGVEVCKSCRAWKSCKTHIELKIGFNTAEKKTIPPKIVNNLKNANFCKRAVLSRFSSRPLPTPTPTASPSSLPTPIPTTPAPTLAPTVFITSSSKSPNSWSWKLQLVLLGCIKTKSSCIRIGCINERLFFQYFSCSNNFYSYIFRIEQSAAFRFSSFAFLRYKRVVFKHRNHFADFSWVIQDCVDHRDLSNLFVFHFEDRM